MKCFSLTACLLITAVAPTHIARAADAAPATVVPNAVIVLNRSGLYPSSITMPTGPFILVLHNRLPAQDETMQVVQKGAEPGASTPSVATSAGHAMAWQLLNLTPGNYVVSFKNHPNLSVAMTITN
jgi:hypothetical protein